MIVCERYHVEAERDQIVAHLRGGVEARVSADLRRVARDLRLLVYYGEIRFSDIIGNVLVDRQKVIFRSAVLCVTLRVVYDSVVREIIAAEKH